MFLFFKKKFFYCSFFIQLISYHLIFAQTNTSNLIDRINYSPISTAVPFVLMPSDANTGGFANAGISALPSASSSFWSIAKTARIEDKYSLNFNYSPLLANLQIDNYALLTVTNTYRFSNRNAISLFGKYLNMSKYEITNLVGETITSVRPLQFLVGIGYALPLNRNLYLGFSGKYIHSSLAPGYTPTDGSNPLNVASAFAVDFSLEYVKKIQDYKLNAGLSIVNLGNKVSYSTNGRSDFLPANIGIGVGFSGEIAKDHAYHLGLDLNKVMVPVRSSNDSTSIKNFYNQNVLSSWANSFTDAKNGFSEELSEIYAQFGTEYIYKNYFHAKLGFIYQNPQKGNGTMITFGTSVLYSNFMLDFSYAIPVYSSNNANTSPLANSFRLGISYLLTED